MGSAANRRAADGASAPAATVVDTPDTPTIQTLVDLFNARDDLRRGDRPWTRQSDSDISDTGA